MNAYSDPRLLENILVTLVPVLISSIPTTLFSIATYVLSALALYTVATRRGIRKAWLSWIPLLNVWILGAISDQYRYVVKGQIKSKRKILLIMNIVVLILGLTIAGTVILAVVRAAASLFQGGSNHFILNLVTPPLIAAVCFGLPLMGIAIASAVIRYMALYDIYTSMDPGNNVLFLVLSIFFGVTEPFFLFFNRNKDLGMPPRKQNPVYEESYSEEPVWQQGAEV